MADADAGLPVDVGSMVFTTIRKKAMIPDPQTRVDFFGEGMPDYISEGHRD